VAGYKNRPGSSDIRGSSEEVREEKGTGELMSIPQQDLIVVSGLTREALEEFRHKSGMKKNWFKEDGGKLIWSSRAVDLLEIELGLQAGELIDKWHTMAALATVDDQVQELTVIKMCINRTIIRGCLDGQQELVSVRIPTNRNIRGGHKILVKKLSEGLYRYMGRVKK